MKSKKRDKVLARAKDMFTYCMESDDPRLDEIIWIETLHLNNPNAIQVRNYSEPITLRKAILATLFEFPECINIDTRIIRDDGVDYYEGKSKFIAPSGCTPEQQTAIQEMKTKIEKLSLELGDGATNGTKGNITLNINLGLKFNDIDFENIIEWLNFYCAKNVDKVGTRSTERVYMIVTKEVLERAGIELNDYRFRKVVNEDERIGSREIVEAVQMKEIPEAIDSKKSLKDFFESIRKYFDDKINDRINKRYFKYLANIEADRYNHYL